MRVIVEQLDRHGDVVDSDVLEGHPVILETRLPLQLVLEDTRGGAVLRYGPHEMNLAVGERARFEIADVRLRFTLLRDRISGGRGRCPYCACELRYLNEVKVGAGAYRSMARDVRRCPRCAIDVVALSQAAAEIGTFVDLARSDWYFVAAPHRCPICTNLLARSRLRTQRGEAHVERCGPCDVVVLHERDREALLGGAD